MASSLTNLMQNPALFTVARLEPFFSYYYAFDSYTGYAATYTLYQDACQVNVNGSVQNNCPELCKNHPELYWNSLPALVNCVATPMIAANLSKADGDLNKQAASFGIQGTAAGIELANNTEDIATCLSQYYQFNAEKLGADVEEIGTNGRSSCEIANLLPQPGLFNLTEVQECYIDLCSGADLSLDSDLGGIGIFLSYYIQLGISIFGIVVARLLDSWVYNGLRWPLRCLGKEAAERISKRIQSRLQIHKPPLVAAMLDFHKVQCFFMLAVQAAALVVMRAGTLNVSSLGQAQLNFSFLQLVAANCYLPVTYTMWYMRRFSPRSAYTYLLTLSAFSLSAATAVTAYWEGLYATFTETASTGIAACGGFTPTSQCASNSFGSSATGQFSQVSLSIASVTMFLITCDYLSHLLRLVLDPQKCKKFDIYFSPRKWKRKGLRRTFRVFTKFWDSLVLLAAVYVYVSLISSLNEFFIGRTSVQTWGLGQVVGFTTFLPSALEFVYLDIVGMESGSEYRLPNKFRVMRVATDPRDIDGEGESGGDDDGVDLLRARTDSSFSEKAWPTHSRTPSTTPLRPRPRSSSSRASSFHQDLQQQQPGRLVPQAERPGLLREPSHISRDPVFLRARNLSNNSF